MYVHTPLISSSDCEGAGEMFSVTTLLKDPKAKLPRKPDGALGLVLACYVCRALAHTCRLVWLCCLLCCLLCPGTVDYSHDFFGKSTGLAVSGQLQVESFCSAHSEVYTFGPTFRAENSHTSRHLAEFWMIEPEIAYEQRWWWLLACLLVALFPHLDWLVITALPT